ncbi:MAG: hypothetical protein JJE13_07630 [Thermoleophilia bacterium]|nr:hypothetical protein [Thermoleophilia bacterium]
MAQTKKKRNRKRRGTQAGSIDTRKKARPKNRQEARGQAKSKSTAKNRGQKVDAPPTWGSAALRGIIASLVFVVLLVLLFKRSIAQALPIGAFLLVFYIPAGYYMDTVMWRRRERNRIRASGK